MQVRRECAGIPEQGRRACLAAGYMGVAALKTLRKIARGRQAGRQVGFTFQLAGQAARQKQSTVDMR